MSIPQIYIPRVLTNVTWQYVKCVFDEVLGAGAVKRVHVVKVGTKDIMRPPNFNRVYVDINFWPKGTEEVSRRLLQGEIVKLYPNESNQYWMCVLNRNANRDTECNSAELDSDCLRRRKAPRFDLTQHYTSPGGLISSMKNMDMETNCNDTLTSKS